MWNGALESAISGASACFFGWLGLVSLIPVVLPPQVRGPAAAEVTWPRGTVGAKAEGRSAHHWTHCEGLELDSICPLASGSPHANPKGPGSLTPTPAQTPHPLAGLSLAPLSTAFLWRPADLSGQTFREDRLCWGWRGPSEGQALPTRGPRLGAKPRPAPQACKPGLRRPVGLQGPADHPPLGLRR